MPEITFKDDKTLEQITKALIFSSSNEDSDPLFCGYHVDHVREGFLTGSFEKGKYVISRVVVPKQNSGRGKTDCEVVSLQETIDGYRHEIIGQVTYLPQNYGLRFNLEKEKHQIRILSRQTKCAPISIVIRLDRNGNPTYEVIDLEEK